MAFEGESRARDLEVWSFAHRDWPWVLRRSVGHHGCLLFNSLRETHL